MLAVSSVTPPALQVASSSVAAAMATSLPRLVASATGRAISTASLSRAAAAQGTRGWSVPVPMAMPLQMQMRGVQWRRPFSAEAAGAGVLDSEENCVDEGDPLGVVPILADVSRITDHSLSLPRVVVIGNQSSGKSSVLEGILGMDVLPKGNSMVTRRPLELTLLRTGSGTWVEFEDDPSKYFDMEQVQQRILDENLSVDFSDEPLRVTVHAPHVHNTTLVDLPGYIQTVRAGQSIELPKQIQDLCRPYVQDPQNIILTVVSAVDDLANSKGLSEAQQLDPGCTRTMGVVTKCDLPKVLDPLIETLQNRNYPLGLGYIGVRCRTQQELKDGVDFEELARIEESYFGASGIASEIGVRTGLPKLRVEVSQALLRKISSQLPTIIAKLDAAIEVAKRNESFLDTLAREQDLKTVAKELESLVKQLHPSASSRKTFEIGLRHKLRAEIRRVWKQAQEDNFVYDFKEPVGPAKYDRENMRDEARHLLEVIKDHAYGEEVFDVEAGRRDKWKDDLELSDGSTVPHAAVPPYRELFLYGEAPLDKVTDESLEVLRRRGVAAGAIAAYYKHTFPENLREDRAEWGQSLTNAVDDVLHRHDLAQASFDLLMDELVKFANNTRVANPRSASNQHADLARMFFQYLFEKIAARIQAEGLAETMRGMVDREKRPCTDFLEIQHELARQMKHPEKLGWFFGDTNSQLNIPMFSKEWTDAYIEVVSKRTSEDIFRIIGVRLLEPLIFECISYSLNLFRSEKIAREATKQTEYTEKLIKYRDILVEAQERYHD